jgi:hypothetical protein
MQYYIVVCKASQLMQYYIIERQASLIDAALLVVVHKASVTMQHIVRCAQRCLFDDTTLRSCRIVSA